VQEVDNRKAAMEAAIAAGMAFMKGDKATALVTGIRALSLYATEPGETNEAAKEKQIKVRSTVADVIQFSGCRDEQTSADGSFACLEWMICLLLLCSFRRMLLSHFLFACL